MKKKLTILIPAFSFFLSSLFCQSEGSPRSENFSIQNFREIKIKVPTPKNHLSLEHIHGVRVIDVRPDSVAIGFMQKHPLNYAFIVLPKTVRQESEDYINEYLQLTKKDSSGTLVVVLKKMWLTDELASATENDYVNEKIWNDRKTFTSGIIMKVEFYFQKENQYYPLYRYDSVLRDSFTITRNGPQYINEALISSLQRLSSIDKKLNDLSTKRKLTWDEIDQHNQEDCNMPILKNSTFQRGVYMTFEEFKNNMPSKTNFEVKKDEKNDILYIIGADGKALVERNVWGYCDGKNLFIKAGENFFILQRRENAFYIYGAKKLTRRYVDAFGIPAGPSTSSEGPSMTYYGTAVGRTQPALRLEPLQLDLDTGKLE